MGEIIPMRPEVGKIYFTKGGHKVGPLEETEISDWPFVVRDLDIPIGQMFFSDNLYFNNEGIAEGDGQDDRYPEYDLILEKEKLEAEDFV